MISIAVLSTSPERRSGITERLCTLQRLSVSKLSFLPELHIKPVAPEELHFTAAPDICIIDEEYAAHDLMEIAQLRKLLPHTSLIVEIDTKLNSLLIVEQLARLGIHDTISPTIAPEEFFRKIILLTKQHERPKHGTLLIVDSGKGGSGVTSVVAALGELCSERGKKVALVDLDIETQDLSRFLQVKPFVNENLDALLSLHRPIVKETIEQCVVQHYDDSDLFCIPPPVSDFYPQEATNQKLRAFISFLENLDAQFDLVIIDTACSGRVMRQTLYRIADKILFVLNTDPASMFAASERIQQANALAGQGDVVFVENNLQKFGLPSKLFRYELARAAHCDAAQWITSSIPFCKAGLRWPGSHYSMYGIGKEAVRSGFRRLAGEIGLIEDSEKLSHTLLGKIFHKRKKLEASKDKSIVQPEIRELPVQQPKLPLLISKDELVSEASLSTLDHVSSDDDPVLISGASVL